MGFHCSPIYLSKAVNLSELQGFICVNSRIDTAVTLGTTLGLVIIILLYPLHRLLESKSTVDNSSEKPFENHKALCTDKI